MPPVYEPGGLTALALRTWCGRHRIEDVWFKVGPNVMIEGADTTPGICEDCIGALRSAGLSL